MNEHYLRVQDIKFKQQEKDLTYLLCQKKTSFTHSYSLYLFVYTLQNKKNATIRDYESVSGIRKFKMDLLN